VDTAPRKLAKEDAPREMIFRRPFADNDENEPEGRMTASASLCSPSR
jgi:hypothetical protein